MCALKFQSLLCRRVEFGKYSFVLPHKYPQRWDRILFTSWATLSNTHRSMCLALLTCALKFKYMVPVTFWYFMCWTAHTGAHGVSEHYLSFALTIPWSTDKEHTTGHSTLPILWLKFRDIRAYPLKSIQCMTVSWSIFLDTLYTHQLHPLDS